MNISEVKGCYGCGVCAAVCPKKIIDLRTNKEGFYEPYITEPESCIDCSLCVSVCGYLANRPLMENSKIEAYAGWSKDEHVRYITSSGGVAYELGRLLLSEGYEACAVKYDVDKRRAVHYIAHNEKEFELSAGSKYIQSYTFDGFSQLKRGHKYYVVGTPCQIDSLRRMVRKKKMEENFVFLDFFCHGVPSILVWEKYLKESEEKIGSAESVLWRNKEHGWHDSWNMTIINGEKKITSRLTKGDLFYKFFLGNACLGKACYNKCKYKALSSSADIRVGDLWGNAYKNNDAGVCGVLVFTDKGRQCIEKLRETCQFNIETNNNVLEDQLGKHINEPFVRRYVLKELHTDKSLRQIYNKWLRPYKYSKIPKRIINKIIRIIRR